MGTQTVPNGSPHGPRDVQWGREVVSTVVSVIAILLVILGLIVGAVVYNAREFQFAADDRASMKLHIERLDGDLKSLGSQLALRVQTADKAHEEYDHRIDSLETWRYGQTISGWKPRRGKR